MSFLVLNRLIVGPPFFAGIFERPQKKKLPKKTTKIFQPRGFFRHEDFSMEMLGVDRTNFFNDIALVGSIASL